MAYFSLFGPIEFRSKPNVYEAGFPSVTFTFLLYHLLAKSLVHLHFVRVFTICIFTTLKNM
jgi:hypothetical protein